MNKKLFKDFCTFSMYQLASWDIDPVYPVLKRYYKLKRFDEETALWFTVLYVGFYHLGSAQEAFNRYPKLAKVKQMTYPTGIERRGFRGNDLASNYLNGIYDRTLLNELTGEVGLVPWVKRYILKGKPRKSWQKIREEFQTIPYCGPWASYKWADLLKNVHGYKISANDIGVGGNSETAGPIPGMVLITGLNWKECALNVKVQNELMNNARSNGVPFNGLDQLETCLCDFNSMVKGHYYSGHDVDIQMEQLPKTPLFAAARRWAIPRSVRGEFHQRWVGVRKPLKTLYRDKGVIHTDLDTWR